MKPSRIMDTVVHYPFEIISRNPKTVAHDMVTNVTYNNVIDWYCDTGVNSFSKATQWLCDIMATKQPPVHIPHVFYSEPRETLAERLCNIHKMDQVFFSNDGTGAVETAIKLARKYNHDKGSPGRDTIWVRKNSFHGRTYGALSASINQEITPYHHNGFAPELSGFMAFDTVNDIEFYNAQAVMITPIYDNSDVRLPDVQELKHIRYMCAKHNIPLIFDEVQSGHGRCGDWSAAHLYGVQPDIMCFAKGLAAGLPIGATLAIEPFCVLTPGSQFSTFGGNNIACLLAHKVLDELSEPNVFTRINLLGDYLAAEFEQLSRGEFKGVLGEVRWTGLMLCLDTPGLDAKKFGEVAMRHGLICGCFRSTRMRVYPHLDVDLSSINTGLIRFKEAVAETMRV